MKWPSTTCLWVTMATGPSLWTSASSRVCTRTQCLSRRGPLRWLLLRSGRASKKRLTWRHCTSTRCSQEQFGLSTTLNWPRTCKLTSWRFWKTIRSVTERTLKMKTHTSANFTQSRKSTLTRCTSSSKSASTSHSRFGTLFTWTHKTSR